MKAPRYRVGQTVQVVGHRAGELFNNEFFVPCTILHPNDDGTYFACVNKTGGYTLVDESDISAYPEYDPDKPYVRNRISVLFFGNGLFALPTLRMLLEQGYNVVGVVTMEDKPCSRGRELCPSPVKKYAVSKGLPVYQPRKLDSDEFIRHIQALQPTIGVVVEYQILPKELFTIPIWGTINLHSSLLPMYRGASTITSAIKDGNTLTGVTTFYINAGLDKGSVINNLGVDIRETDSAEDVHIRLRNAGAIMVDDAIQRVAHSCRGIPQSDLICDFIKPSHAPKIYRKDAFIPWLESAKRVYDFIRAHSSIFQDWHYSLNPAIASQIPTAWTSLKLISSQSEIDVKIHKASKTGIPRGHHGPGEWFWQNGKLMVACMDELLSVDVLQMAGKNKMTAKEYHNGLREACKGFCNLYDSNDETITTAIASEDE